MRWSRRERSRERPALHIDVERVDRVHPPPAGTLLVGRRDCFVANLLPLLRALSVGGEAQTRATEEAAGRWGVRGPRYTYYYKWAAVYARRSNLGEWAWE